MAWRPILSLVLAGLLGWLAAWFMLAPGPLLFGEATRKAESAVGARQSAPIAAVASGAVVGQTAGVPVQPTLEQLLQRQEKISEGASRSTAVSPQTGQAGASVVPQVKLPTPDARAAARVEKMKLLSEMQMSALAEIQSITPGDTKKMMAAIERFDGQMRAAGVPSIIDLDNFRKMLETTDRLQQLNRLLVEEANKGRNADGPKVKAMAQEIQILQQAMPRQFIKTDVLKKQMAP